MSLITLFSFIIYCFVTSVTPGPNNIMLASSGITFGFKRSIPHILGIGFGFGLMVILVGLGLGTLLSTSPMLFTGIKVLGIAYLLYLAYQIYHSDSINTQSNQSKPLSFLGAALFQWVNPKAWIMIMGAVTAYTSAQSSIGLFLWIGFIYGVVSIPSVGIWAYIGESFQRFTKNPKKIKWFNQAMAVLLVISVISPIRELIALV
ncbi:LysE family translocator [Acinetobacter sp. HY1485]|uniref:LysE family translocator n=1 Tax=Acinetobacter sp. HY1485 TaxID=2970918 RepID=UPI0022B9AE9E|nr:LysE family translocator [Acinetobacter sp. HY1485]